MDNAIISLKPEYVQKILSGEKTMEVRRKKVNLAPGTRLWIYATLPYGAIRAFATVDEITTRDPNRLWEKHSLQLGINKKKYDNYTKGCNEVTGIRLKGVRQINPSPKLSFIKSKIKKFHPPQFFARLPENSPLLKILNSFVS